jgi:hypothetical protein
MNQPSYTSVDEVQAQTSLADAAAKCGVTLDSPGNGRQVRLDCAFGCAGDHAGKREISVDTSNPQKVFCCHAYGCQLRGNLLTLMHGWLTGTRPIGNKLKGEEFKRVRNVLVGNELGAPLSGNQQASQTTRSSSSPIVEAKQPAALRNQPLAESDNEKARALVTLDEKFIYDAAQLPPAAASYLRRHPSLSPALLEKWRVGALPKDGGSDKRGWALRGQLLYPILSESNKLLAWVARNPHFEREEQQFNAFPPEERTKQKKPAKHRFPVDFHRGCELFGQQASRLEEPGYREAIARHGILVVEGFNDVIGLDALGIPAVAIMSNKITTEQIAKIERWAKALAQGKVTLLFDADEPGDTGAKEALWLLAQRQLQVRLGWSRAMHGGAFADRQPESLTREEWEMLVA